MSRDRNAVAPDWEPVPWDVIDAVAAEQQVGFEQRARKPIPWCKVPFMAFPPEGLFGHDRDWFVSHDVAYIASADGEDLILIRRTWWGFPDPPEWGLASRPSGRHDVKWSNWGSFPDPPSAWVFLDGHP